MIDLLKSMAIFSEVVHLGSFRAAAKSQGVSPSVISRHVSILEDSLGEVLLNRSTRKLALTSIGEQFLIHCDQMLQSANQGLAAVKENLNQGHLRVTLPVTLVTTTFGHLVRRFREKNPQIDFSFIFDDSNIDIVNEGVDIALRLGPLSDSSLKAKRIATINRLVVCTPEYLDSVGDITSFKDLNQCTWVGRTNPAALPVIYSESGDVYTVPKQTKFIQVNNVEAIKSFVMSHNGVALFSRMIVERELAEGSLVRLLPNRKVESMSLYAVWSARREAGLLVKKFIDFLSDELDDL